MKETGSIVVALSLFLAGVDASAQSGYVAELPAVPGGGNYLWAQRVLAYDQGRGFAVEFGTGLGFTNAVAILGEPWRTTPGVFGGPVDPFSPPYLPSQLLSVGEGGSVTLELGRPAFNDPAHPFGIDFQVFGNTGFVITNADFTGGGVTDGSLFSQKQGVGRVWVSADGVSYYLLDPTKAPVLDSFFPTDGSGDFQRVVNPLLSGEHFAGQGLAGIRSLYAGSGGGAGFDLSWAVDQNGAPARVDFASYIRLEALSGHLEIDALTVVPEPSSLGLMVLGAMVAVWRSRKKGTSRGHR